MTKKGIILAFLTLSSPTAWGFNVFGDDDRTEVDASSHPYSRIVQIAGGCTGSFVGSNLVLTAAHCIEDQIGRNENGYYIKNEIRIYAGQKRDDVAVATSARWGDIDSNRHSSDDWAVLRINKNLGDTYGYFGFKGHLYVNSSLNNGVSLLAHHGDLPWDKLYSSSGRITYHYSSGKLYHTCDDTRGASGAPIVNHEDGQWLVVALNVAEYRNGGDKSLYLKRYSYDYTNIGVNVGQFSHVIREMRAGK